MVHKNYVENPYSRLSPEEHQIKAERQTQFYRFAEFGRLSSSLLHDLANPLTSVAMNLDELEQSHNKDILNEAKQGISFIENYVITARNQLNKHCQNTIFDSKVELEKVCTFLHSKAKMNKVRLINNMRDDLKIYGECSKYCQLASNLIANAIESYSDQDTSVRVVSIDSNYNAGRISISVADNGDGIPKSEIKKIFEPFYTTKSYQRGTGIGLTFTKRTVEEDFGGKLIVDSDKGKTIFTILIPENSSFISNE